MPASAGKVGEKGTAGDERGKPRCLQDQKEKRRSDSEVLSGNALKQRSTDGSPNRN